MSDFPADSVCRYNSADILSGTVTISLRRYLISSKSMAYLVKPEIKVGCAGSRERRELCISISSHTLMFLSERFLPKKSRKEETRRKLHQYLALAFFYSMLRDRSAVFHTSLYPPAVPCTALRATYLSRVLSQMLDTSDAQILSSSSNLSYVTYRVFLFACSHFGLVWNVRGGSKS